MKKTESEKKVQDHYNAVAEGYGKRYQKEFFNDLSVKYPANYFRLQLLINSFTQKGLKRLVEVGVGEGTPLAIMAKAGFDIAGFDISESMVEKCEETLKKHDVEAVEEIFHADIQDPVSYIQIIQNGIRATVYRASAQQHLISEQNPDTLFVIMKSVYANHGLNQNTNITKQVEHLNNLVVEDCTKRIMGEIRGYMNYRRDISTLVKPIDRPKSTYVDKSLKYNKNDLYRQ